MEFALTLRITLTSGAPSLAALVYQREGGSGRRLWVDPRVGQEGLQQQAAESPRVLNKYGFIFPRGEAELSGRAMPVQGNRMAVWPPSPMTVLCSRKP